jgi:hypothetical protein
MNVDHQSVTTNTGSDGAAATNTESPENGSGTAEMNVDHQSVTTNAGSDGTAVMNTESTGNGSRTAEMNVDHPKEVSTNTGSDTVTATSAESIAANVVSTGGAALAEKPPVTTQTTSHVENATENGDEGQMIGIDSPSGANNEEENKGEQGVCYSTRCQCSSEALLINFQGTRRVRRKQRKKIPQTSATFHSRSRKVCHLPLTSQTTYL